MKQTTLPSLVIRNPFSKSPTITEKTKTDFFFYVRCAVIAFFLCLYFIPADVSPTPTVVAPVVSKADIVIDKTTEIIARDGNVPHNVARKYTLWIFEASHKHRVDPLTILSVMSVESTFKQDAVSGANAIGLMQVIHHWHKEKTTQVGLFDPKNNINVGTKILKEYARLSRSDAEMLARYNGTWKKSTKYATKVLAKRTKYQHEIMKAVREA